jgi:hypothetical protein
MKYLGAILIAFMAWATVSGFRSGQFNLGKAGIVSRQRNPGSFWALIAFSVFAVGVLLAGLIHRIAAG